MDTAAAIPLSDVDFARDVRRLEITSQLGNEHLLQTLLVGDEAISETFRYEVSFLSANPNLSPEKLLGTQVTLRIRPTDGEPRVINGWLSRLQAGPLLATHRGFRTYRAEVVPWLWFLSRSSDCRIFQNLSVPEILAAVFDEHGYPDYEIKLDGSSYPKLDFCVQYRESALNFVSRLMENVGIFYFFRHEEARHVLVVADDNSAFAPLAEEAAYAFGASGEQKAGADQIISEWRHSWDFKTGAWAQTDYDFQTPTLNLLTGEKTVLQIPTISSFERFDYPGGYTDPQHGRRLTRTLIEAEEAGHHTIHGVGGMAAFLPGAKFTLHSHPVEAECGKEYVITRVRHEARDESYFAGSADGKPDWEYTNSFELIPASVSFRPSRRTRRPSVQGPQTATVVGPAGEEIYTDTYGRVKVQFHWDRRGQHDENSSVWIRVSHAWAGAGYGSIQIPRIGQEVIVDFLEGDPDMPIITGRVYNAAQMPPHGLPGAAVKSGIKSNSTKGGGGSNELTFDDTKGTERVYLHAQHDMEAVVEHNRTTLIKNDESLTVAQGNRTIKVDTGTHTETIKGATAITITTGAYTHKVVASTAERRSKGESKVISDAANVLIQAATEIKLVVGASSIWMSKDGTIEITGKNITITGSETVSIAGKKISSAATDSHNTTGGIVLSEAKSTNTVRGSMVMLNP